MKSVMIGIQARSGSTRLPRKAFELISGRMMLDRVIETCKTAASNIEKKTNIHPNVVVLTPKGDPIAEEFSSRCAIVEGPEHDVLERYRIGVQKFNPDYVIRITGDCPMIPVFIISNLMSLAINKNYDYISNVDARYRTSMDGADCEVISRRLFDTIADIATTPYDREHVTTLIRKSPPIWARMGLALNYVDHSDVKLSVDTKDDLERVRRAFESAFSKYQEALRFYGHSAVHRL